MSCKEGGCKKEFCKKSDKAETPAPKAEKCCAPKSGDKAPACPCK